jgi:hypothetical protein
VVQHFPGSIVQSCFCAGFFSVQPAGREIPLFEFAARR